MLFLFAEIRPKPEFFEQARASLESLVPLTLEEPGCEQFALHVGEERSALYLYEAFQDAAALAAHYAQPYTRDVFAKYESWLAEPVVVHRMRPPFEPAKAC